MGNLSVAELTKRLEAAEARAEAAEKRASNTFGSGASGKTLAGFIAALDTEAGLTEEAALAAYEEAGSKLPRNRWVREIGAAVRIAYEKGKAAKTA